MARQAASAIHSRLSFLRETAGPLLSLCPICSYMIAPFQSAQGRIKTLPVHRLQRRPHLGLVGLMGDAEPFG